MARMSLPTIEAMVKANTRPAAVTTPPVPVVTMHPSQVGGPELRP
jgi:hypothetical protein